MADASRLPKRPYVIAFSLRSGSNLLCDLLRENGLGYPTEYFQYPFGIANRFWYDELGVSVNDFAGLVSALMEQRSSKGLFGAKVTWDQKNALLQELRKLDSTHAQLHDAWPGLRWLRLSRLDKIGQAISVVRAVQSGSWASTEAASGTPFVYDFFQVLSFFQSILTEECLWDDYFRSHRIPVLHVTYEAFIADPRQTILDIRSYIAPDLRPLTLDDVRIVERLKKQRDSLSSEIRERFVEDLGHIGVAEYWVDRTAELGRWAEFFREKRWNVDR